MPIAGHVSWLTRTAQMQRRVLMHNMISDLAYGLRQIRRNTSTAAVCVLVLGIGIGSATAVFTVLYDAMLRPLPYLNPDQLVYVHNEFPQSQLTRTGESAPDFADLTTHREIFSNTAAYFFNDFTMTGTAYAQHVDAVNVSATLFPMLGIPARIGRTYTTDEEHAGSRVAVLSDSLWRGTFGGDPNAIGRSISLDRDTYQIIGVMPAEFQFPYPATQMWIPLSLSPARFAPRERGRKWLQMVGRLAPRLTPQRANAALVEVSHAYAAAFPDAYPEKAGWHFSCQPMAAQQTAQIRSWLVLAFGAVLCVLLIACINASGLLLVRTTVRQREWAIRASLGATPTRLFRQMFTETWLLALLACGVGIAFAIGEVRLMNDFGPIRAAAVGPWTYVFALAGAVGSTVLAGIPPAAALLRLPLDRSLKTGDGRIATGQRGWRNVLVAGQIAIAIALLFTATALTRSFIKLLDVPLGFSAEQMWTASIQLPDRGPSSAASSAWFFQTLTSRISALPGVESASAGSIPFSPGGVRMVDLYFAGRPVPSVPPAAVLNIVLPNYFGTLRIPFLAGRSFSEQEGPASNAVAIVDRAFAQRYFPNQDAIGKLVATQATKDKPYTIVGIVESVASVRLGEPAEPAMYLSELQSGQSATYLVVREAPGQDATAAVRDALREMDPNVALFDVETMAARVSHAVRLRRFVAWLLNSFAMAGLVLAALGLYATLAHLVELRRREVAIRIAVGASHGSVRRLFARHGLLIASAGLLPGMLLALVAGRVTRSFLFGISSFDALTVAVTLLGFFVLALLASWIPIARATRADVLVALRDE
jgi:putative ABC transport system permease protein